MPRFTPTSEKTMTETPQPIFRHNVQAAEVFGAVSPVDEGFRAARRSRLPPLPRDVRDEGVPANAEPHANSNFGTIRHSLPPGPSTSDAETAHPVHRQTYSRLEKSFGTTGG